MLAWGRETKVRKSRQVEIYPLGHIELEEAGGCLRSHVREILQQSRHSSHAYLSLSLVAPHPLPRALPSPSKHAHQAFDFPAANNTPHFAFVLSAVRHRWPRPADKRAVAKSAAVGAPACVLQKLRGHKDSLLKSIAEFAGVPIRATPRTALFKATMNAL